MTPKPELARRAWTLMFDFLVRTADQRSAGMARRGLSPNDLRAMTSLIASDGRPMRALAEEWRCDASNATLIVDRLERAGLAERLPMPGDARFRLVQLTPKGRRTYAELLDEFHTPPVELLALTNPDLDALRRIMERIPPRDEKESG
jgi:DNA-binding MarR family transcriptional regulator